MSAYTVAQLEEIDEITDGRCPWRPVRQHFGIMSFGVNAWTAANAGDRIINEHDEADETTHEELYLVQRGRARFELDGERVDAPAGTFVFADPGVKRTAFAEEPGTTLIALGGTPGQGVRAERLGGLGAAPPLYEAGKYDEVADRGARADRGPSRVRRRGLQRRVLREPRGADGRRDRASPARDRAGGAVPLVRGRRLRLRSDPRRAGVQGAHGPAPGLLIRVSSRRTVTGVMGRRLLAGAALGAILGTLAAGPALASDAANPIVKENRHRAPTAGTSRGRATGSPTTASSTSRGTRPRRASMQGGVIGLRVTTARHEPYTIDVYRLGYYHGHGGRHVAHLGPFDGAPQPACYTVRATGMVTCPWRTSVRLRRPRSWTSGVYFAVLTTPRSQYQSEIMFTVRDRRPADIVFVSSVNTYQAYNNFPYDPPEGVGWDDGAHPLTGRSLYDFNSPVTQAVSGRQAGGEGRRSTGRTARSTGTRATAG